MKVKKLKRYQVGGLFDTNKQGYVDSVLNAHKDLDWVKRLYEKHPQSIQIPGEKGRSTHFMEDNDNGYVFPSVVNIGGKLQHIPDGAEDYARETNTGIQLPKLQGTWFGRNGYKQGTNVLSGFQNGGTNHFGVQAPYVPSYNHVSDNTHGLQHVDQRAIQQGIDDRDSAENYRKLVAAGMDHHAAITQSRPGVNRLKTAQAMIDHQDNLEYRTKNSQGYDPSRPVEDQTYLSGIDGLDQRLVVS